MEQLTGIKTKDRVKEHGEVFTPDSIVNDMLDLTDEAYEKEGITIKGTPQQYIEKTYLEPACGNGNFLIRILDRKMDAVRQLPVEQQERALVQAVSTIYGIDIQSDNVYESRDRMLELIKNGSIEVLELKDKEVKSFSGPGFEITPQIEDIIKSILEKNIQHGNMLDGRLCSSASVSETKPEDKEMLIIEYKFTGDMVELEACTLNSMQENQLSFPVATMGPGHYLMLMSLLAQLENDEESDDEDVTF